MGCFNNKKMTATNKAQTFFDKQGHRGCRGLLPENTIPAMLHALQLGATTLEMDIVFTKDSVAILSHEPFFNHEITTLPNGNFIPENEEKNYNIFNLTFAQTQQFDVGLKQHPRFAQQQKIAVHKPSLAIVFDSVQAYVQRYNIPYPYFNIETKTTPATDNIYHPTPTVFVDMLMNVITQKQMEKWVTIQSFDRRTLQYLHTNYPTIPTILLVEDTDTATVVEQIKNLGFNPTTYSPHYSMVNAQLVAFLKQQHIKLIPWTVNDLPTIKSLTVLGVDGIITDYPNLFNGQ
jgi:glycerophosphoryl diester phosphodiesterase